MQMVPHTVGGLCIKPRAVLLMNEGMRLVTNEPNAFGELTQLSSHGIDILACGTCFERFNLTGKVAVGKV